MCIRDRAKELEVQQLRNKIQSEVQDRVQQTQREYYLREQMKACLLYTSRCV